MKNGYCAENGIEIDAVPNENDFTQIKAYEVYKPETGYKPEVYKTAEEAIARYNELIRR